MSKKSKKPIPAIETVAQLHETIDEITRIEIKKRQLEADRDAAVQAVLDQHDGPIEQIKKRLKSLMSLAGTYAAAHRESIFGKAKSVFSKLARFGFRDGNPSVVLLNKKHSWDGVMEKIKAAGKDAQFIRTVEEVNKEAIRDAKLSDAELAELGLRLDQGTRFFVESKAEDADRMTLKTDDADAA